MNPTPDHSTTGSASVAAPGRPGILVVDDDPTVLKMLRATLLHKGFRVWAAGSGSAAVELARSAVDQIDVLLLDVCMPGLDGPATLAELRRTGVSVPACFMSGHSDRYSVDELLGMGAERYFQKPFQIEALTGEMWQLAQRKAA